MLPLTATTDWLSAVGGIVTTAVALYLLGQGQLDRRRRSRQERRAQASRVALSVGDWNVSSLYNPVSLAESLQEFSRKFTVSNRTLDVIFDLSLTLTWDEPNPIPEDQILMASFYLERLDGNEEHAFVLPLGTRRYTYDFVPVKFDGIDFDFTDAAGVRWRRDLRHVLTEVIRCPPRPGRLGEVRTRLDRWWWGRKEGVTVV